MKSFGLILGSSGTGKGTRLNQFMQFLNTKFTPEDYQTKDKNGGIFNLGLYYKELDLLILGKYVNNKQTNISSWSSMDSIWSKFGGTEPTIQAISELNYNILCEGYANMDTFRVRPAHIHSKGCDKFFYQVYSYGKDGYQNYLNRIIGRSGKEPKGTTAFEKESQVLRWYDKIINEMQSLNLETNNIYHYNYDEHIASIGSDYLRFINMFDMYEQFMKYCEINKHFKEYKPSINNNDW